MITVELAYNDDGVVATGYVADWNKLKPLTLHGWLRVYDTKRKCYCRHDEIAIQPVNGSKIKFAWYFDHARFLLSAGVDMSLFDENGRFEWGQFQLEFKGAPELRLDWAIHDINEEVIPPISLPSFAFREVSHG